MDTPSESTRVKASLAGLEGVTAALDRWRIARGLQVSAVWPFQVALDEMLSNTLRCGYADDPEEHEIEVRFAIEGGLMQVAIVDDAAPFDPLQAKAPDTTAPLEQRRAGGLGIFLVRELMDEVRYQRVDGCNVLTLRKRVHS